MEKHDPPDVAERERPQELDAVVERRQRERPAHDVGILVGGDERRGEEEHRQRAELNNAKSAQERISVVPNTDGAANAAETSSDPGTASTAHRESTRPMPASRRRTRPSTPHRACSV